MAKSIFIASSSESKNVATQIAQALADSGFNPRRWWTEFPPGSITISRLKSIASEVDGAVFIFAKDDVIWFRRSEHETPRDNVLLEYGLFLANIGLEKCLIVFESGTKIPSDLCGLSLESLARDIESTKERCSKHFLDIFGRREDTQGNVVIVVDPKLVEIETFESYERSYILRQCYLGSDGAKSWLRISSDHSYESDEQVAASLTALLEMLDEVSESIETFVSLGPGDGKLDKSMLSSLVCSSPSVRYIPVDINSPILQKSIKDLAQIVTVPLGIHADFESNFPFVARILSKNARGRKIISMLGNTFGNFDTNESLFLSSIGGYAEGGDLLLLGVASKKSETLGFDLSEIPRSMKEFLANGISVSRKIKKEDAVAHFEDYCDVDIASRRSVIEGTITIRIYDKDNKRAYGYFRRYEEKSLLEFFNKRDRKWRVVSSRSVVNSSNYSDFFVLLERSKRRT